MDAKERKKAILSFFETIDDEGVEKLWEFIYENFEVVVTEDDNKAIAIKLNPPKTKKSLLEVLGSLKPTFPIDVDVNEAIDFARTERAREIVRKLKDMENK